MDLFTEINIDSWHDGLIFLDIDGTLVADGHCLIDKKTLRVLQKLKRGNRVYLCSNGRDRRRNRKISRVTGIEYLDTDLRKPNRKILELVDHSSFKKRLVVGDKFLTDGLFARHIGADFVKVKRIASCTDSFSIRLVYWFDDLLFKVMK